MAVKMRRNFSGASSARVAADGTLRIVRREAPDVRIIVVGADPRRVKDWSTTLHDLEIEWQGKRVLLTTVTAGRAAMLEARNAIVHEALPDLYRALPLAAFDARARRFWRRVFLLVKIPGGRRLLGMLARSSRDET